MDSKLQLTAAILAGGKNKRFGGKIKSLQLLNGKQIITSQIDVLSKLFSEIIIIANEKIAFQEYSSYSIYSDVFRDKGPLAGIHAALKYARHKDVFIVAGDMPFLKKDTILAQAKHYFKVEVDALVPKHPKGMEPLHGFYSKSILSKTEESLNGNINSVSQLLQSINAYYWNVENLKDFVNINSPNDLAKH